MTRELIEQMLECIEELRYSNTTHAADTICDSAITAAREYLAQPEQSEPVAWMNPKEGFAPDAIIWTRDERNHPEYNTPLYTQPKAPKPLTDEEIDVIQKQFNLVASEGRSFYGDDYEVHINDKYGARKFARAVLAAQRSKE